MDEAIIKRYRNLLKTGFTNAGEIESPSVFIDSAAGGIDICGQGNFIHLYLDIRGDTVVSMKYLCICEPTTNVAIEILCTLAAGKSIEEVKNITAESISMIAESNSEELIEKADKLIELMGRGIDKYLREQHNTAVGEAKL